MITIKSIDRSSTFCLFVSIDMLWGKYFVFRWYFKVSNSFWVFLHWFTAVIICDDDHICCLPFCVKSFLSLSLTLFHNTKAKKERKWRKRKNDVSFVIERERKLKAVWKKVPLDRSFTLTFTSILSWTNTYETSSSSSNEFHFQSSLLLPLV